MIVCPLSLPDHRISTKSPGCRKPDTPEATSTRMVNARMPADKRELTPAVSFGLINAGDPLVLAWVARQKARKARRGGRASKCGYPQGCSHKFCVGPWLPVLTNCFLAPA